MWENIEIKEETKLSRKFFRIVIVLFFCLSLLELVFIINFSSRLWELENPKPVFQPHRLKILNNEADIRQLETREKEFNKDVENKMLLLDLKFKQWENGKPISINHKD